jgi:hypothetical protein
MTFSIYLEYMLEKDTYRESWTEARSIGSRPSNGDPGSFHVCRPSSMMVDAKRIDIGRRRQHVAWFHKFKTEPSMIVHGSVQDDSQPRKRDDRPNANINE